MSTLLFANNAQTTLAGPIAAGALSVNLAAGTGQEFANPTVGQYFVLTFTDAATGLLHEIVWVTARTGDTLTVVRAQEGTTARSWLAGDIAGNWWTAGSAATMVQVQTLQTQPGNYAVDTGSANNIQIVLNPAPATLATIAGAPIRVLVKATNTGATTLTISGLASTIVFPQSGSTSTLPAGAVVGGQIYEFTYTPSLGFEVATAKVLLSTPNTWAQTQTIANAMNWSGNNTTGGVQPMIGVDSNNQLVIFTGPSGNSAWRVVGPAGTNLLSLGSSGLFNAVGGITSTLGSTNTGNQNRVTILADFASVAVSASTGWAIIPSFGLGSNNNMIVQWGEVGVSANNTPTAFNLPRPFPANFAAITISYGANLPPQAAAPGTIGAEPRSLTQFTATNTSTGGGSNGCFFIAIGW